MKQLSHWGNQHKTAARVIITALHFIIIFLVITLGKLMARQGVIVEEWLLLPLAVAIAVVLFVYPNYRNRPRVKRNLSGVLLFTGMLGYGLISCQLSTPTNPPLLTQTESVGYGQFVVNKKKADRQERRSLRKRVRAEIRQWIKSEKANGKMSSGGAVALTILIVLGVLFLETVVLALSCSLACSGAEALGVLVLVGGTLGLVYLGFVSIRAVFRKRRDTKAAEEAGIS